MPPTRQQQPQFSKDEKVLCFHMDMLYEAKIMDVQPAGDKPSDGFRYKVHYKGWKNTWDDWVLVDRIRPLDDEHKELAAQLHAQLRHNMQKNVKQPKKNLRPGASESARGSEERASSTVQGGRGGRRGKDWELEQVRSFLLLILPPLLLLYSPRPILLDIGYVLPSRHGPCVLSRVRMRMTMWRCSQHEMTIIHPML